MLFGPTHGSSNILLVNTTSSVSENSTLMPLFFGYGSQSVHPKLNFSVGWCYLTDLTQGIYLRGGIFNLTLDITV
jgi:amino acid permease